MQDAVGKILRVVLDGSDAALAAAFDLWRCGPGQVDYANPRIRKGLEQLAKQNRLRFDPATAAELLFAAQAYYALAVVMSAGSGDCLFHEAERNPAANSPMALWHRALAAKALAAEPPRRCAAISLTNLHADHVDPYRSFYETLFPRSLRHGLGQYYTPPWLAALVLDEAQCDGAAPLRVLDPTCGSGVFLSLALRRCSANGGVRPSAAQLCQRIVGFDIDPLAVLTARANYLRALRAGGMIAVDEPPPELPVYLCDAVLGDAPPLEPFDCVVGNPPWIAWDHLPAAYREATKPLWQRYGLFSLGGAEARHGGGKKDLAMLVLYVAADRHLRDGGRLAMVVTQTVFQTKGAGDGFRRFQLGDGAPLGVRRVHDLVAVRPFAPAANWTATILLEKGRPTEYPVPYVRWSPAETGSRVCGMPSRGSERVGMEGKTVGLVESNVRWVERSEPHRGPGADPAATETTDATKTVGLATLDPPYNVAPPCNVAPPYDDVQREACLAAPIDPARPSSPWAVWPEAAAAAMRDAAGRADYVAHLGANTGGANGVLWVELSACDGPLATVRNLAGAGKTAVDAVEATVEAELLYPLLRWGDVARWRAVPHCHLLLMQDPQSRRGLGELIVATEFPRAHAYLQRFRDVLLRRAAYRRYQSAGPFWAMYDVGPYTVAPIKVVWRRMDRRIQAAVVETVDDPRLGRRPVIPQETCAMIAADSLDAAHYVCAVLNSRPVHELVAAHSVRGGKGFGTPSMLDYLPIRRYDASNEMHRCLAALSRAAHDAALCTDDLAAIQCQIDRQAAALWDGEGCRDGRPDRRYDNSARNRT